MRSLTHGCLPLTILYFYKWESLETMFNNRLFDKNLMNACLAAVLALGLAACGGSSSDTATAPPTTAPEPPAPTMPEPEPEPTPVAVTIPDATYLDADNTPMAGTFMLQAGMTATRGGVTFLCAAGGDDCEVTIADDGSATATGGTVTASLTATAMTQVANAKDAKADEMVAARDRIIGEDRALEAAANIGTAGPAEANIVISRAAGKAASVVVSTPAGYVASATPAMTNGGWAGTRLTRSLAGATQHLVVYTDIEAPTRVQFYDFDADATTPFRYGTANTTALTSATIAALPIGGTNPAVMTQGTLDPTKFDPPGPAGGGDVTQTFRGTATGADGTNAGINFKGNYNGAPGTYVCAAATANGNNCVVTIPESGPYTSADTWTFLPELGSTAWQNDQESMNFGWWLQEPTNPNGAYTFEYYANGTNYIAAGTPSGTATYKGRAAGRYVDQTIDDSGVTGGTAGQFTAAASLTANFDALNNAGASAPTIKGTISGFQGENGSMPNWQVTLHSKSLTGGVAALTAVPVSGQPDPTLPAYDGVTATMGDQTAYGDWTGQLFGNAADATGTSINNAQPLGIGGTFQADNDAVSIGGAYGARR